MDYPIHSLNVGIVQEIVRNGKTIHTAIHKQPISGPVLLTQTGFLGDEQGDLIHHGGCDKAVCAYPYDHYSFWEDTLQRSLPAAAFGENVTIVGLTEEQVRIGDIFRLGEATLQVSQPRQPCFKLGLKHQEPKLPQWVQETGRTGFYFRVLKEGSVQQTDRLKRIAVNRRAPTVAEANEIMYEKPRNLEKVKRLLAVSELAESWQKALRTALSSYTQS